MIRREFYNGFGIPSIANSGNSDVKESVAVNITIKDDPP